MNQIPVIFENNAFVVINKPVGIGMHQEDDTVGIITLLQRQLSLSKLWLVHRLDKITSGLMIVAKSSHIAALLGESFANHQIQKYYLALSDKKPKKKQGTVMGDMRKIRDGKWGLTQSKNNPATTQFFSCGAGSDGLRFFIVKPHSGKTHQIRVTLKSLGSPILGDQFYTGTPSDRTYLHAYMLEFSLNGQSYSFRCMPDFGKYFESIENAVVTTEYLEPTTLAWPAVIKRNALPNRPA